MSDRAIGIDIGGTKMQIGVVQNGAILQEIRFETAASASQEHILSELASHLETLLDEDVAGIGIGTPGLVDEENGIVYNVQNIPSWQQVRRRWLRSTRRKSGPPWRKHI